MNPKLDVEKRTFSGLILWDEFTVMGGEDRWDFNMIFSEDWNTIEFGGVVVHNKNSGTDNILKFDIDLFYSRHVDRVGKLVNRIIELKVYEKW